MLAILLGWVQPAYGDGDTSAGGGGSSDPTIGVNLPGGPGGGGGGGGGGVRCQFLEASQSTGGSPNVPIPVPGQQYLLVCWDASGQVVFAQVVTYNPAVPAIASATLARQAWSQLPLVFPTAHTSPDQTRPQYTGLPSWMWVAGADWSPRSASATVPGLSATVTATPERVEWDMGDGRPVEVCDAGVAYDTTRPAAEQSTTCSHTFKDASVIAPGGVFRVMATMWWSVRWQASDGSAGVLPDAFRSTTFDVRVLEIEALRRGDGR